MAKKNENSPKVALDEILTNLQKSFSRNAEKSSANKGFTASIVGGVNFELRVRLDADQDKLIQSEEGSIELVCSGVIDPEKINEDE